MTKVTIIVVNYNQARDTKECLDSLLKLDRSSLKVEVLVVDNASVKPFKLSKKYPRWFKVIRSQSNLGFTGGNNLGIHYSIEHFEADFILLLNNDTIVDKKFLKQLINHAQTYPDHGVISSKIYFYPGREFHSGSYKKKDRGRVLWYAGGSIDWQHLSAFHRGVDELDRGQFDTQVTSDFATGCTMLIRREVLEKVGTLDKRYFVYYEDTDYSLRVRKAGFKVGFCAQSLVWHKNAGSSGGAGSEISNYYQTRNRHLLAWLHGDLKAKITSLRLMSRDLMADKIRRKAIIDLVSRKFGKQPLLLEEIL